MCTTDSVVWPSGASAAHATLAVAIFLLIAVALIATVDVISNYLRVELWR